MKWFFVFCLLSLSANAQQITSSPRANPSHLAATSPTNPTGTVNTTGVMMGLGSAVTITPRATGIVSFSCSGTISNNTASQASATHLRYGTGAAPSNGAVKTTGCGGGACGTAVGGTAQGTNPSYALVFPFALQATITGLTVGTQIWGDLDLNTSNGTATATVTNVSCSMDELN